MGGVGIKRTGGAKRRVSVDFFIQQEYNLR